MKGSITKRGEKRYLIRLVLGYDANGKRIIKSHTVHGTKKLAEAVRAQMVAQYEGVSLIDEKKGTLNDYLEEWLAYKVREDDIAYNTEFSYALQVRLYIKDGIGKLPLAKVSTSDIRALYSSLKDRGFAKSTRGLVHTILLQAFDMAVEDKRIPSNPALRAKKKRVSRRQRVTKPKRAFTIDQVNQFLAHTEGFDRTFFATAFVAGTRPGETVALTWPSIGWEQGQLSVTQSMLTKRGESVDRQSFSDTKTVGSQRTIKIPDQLLNELRAHRVRVAEMKRFAGQDWQENDLVFPGMNGGLIPMETIRARFKATLKRAGLPREFRVYDCRHTMATILLLEGENIKVVSERLGHASVRVTLEFYIHALPNMQKRASERLGELFFQAA